MRGVETKQKRGFAFLLRFSPFFGCDFLVVSFCFFVLFVFSSWKFSSRKKGEGVLKNTRKGRIFFSFFFFFFFFFEKRNKCYLL